MSTQVAMKISLIAPCGMNCAICLGHLRRKKTCPGCRTDDPDKTDSCRQCIIVKCAKLKQAGKGYCFACETFPCRRLKQLDKRYRLKYGMSMLENLQVIKTKGIRYFVKSEKSRWKCPGCREILCVHRPDCLACGAPRDPKIKNRGKKP